MSGSLIEGSPIRLVLRAGNMHVLHALLNKEGHHLTDRGTDGARLRKCRIRKEKLPGKGVAGKMENLEMTGLENMDENSKQWKKMGKQVYH